MRHRNEFSAHDLNIFVRAQKNIFFSKSDSSLPYSKKNYHTVTSTDREGIQRVFREFCGGIPRSITRFSSSSLHRVYRVASKTGAYIIRIWDEENKIPPIHFFAESRLVSRLAYRHIPVVSFSTIDTSRKLAPFAFQILESAKGTLLYTAAQKKKNFSVVHKNLGTVVADIHSLHLEGYGRLVPDSISGKKVRGCMKSWQSFLAIQLDRHIAYCRTKKFLTRSGAEDVSEVLKEGIGSVSMHAPRLLHGDLAHHNLFSDGHRITGIIDWEDALAGDPVYDIAYWGTGSFGHDMWLAAFLKGYTSVRQLPKDFTFRYWLYYLRIALAKTVARHRFASSDFSSQGVRFSDRILYGLTQLRRVF